MNEIVNLISTVGFPMAVALIMMWYVNKINENYHNQLQKMSESHQKEIMSLEAAIKENTIMLREILLNMKE